MFGIGEFSKITGLTVKAIRFYHSKNILIPARVEAGSGYRFFDQRNVETARVICALRDFGFSVAEIKSILSTCSQDEDLFEHLGNRRLEIERQIKSQSKILDSIDQILEQQEKTQLASSQSSEVAVCDLPELLVGGIRVSGKYADTGKVLGRLARACGRHISGPAMCLYFDSEFKDEGAEFEPMFPIGKHLDVDGVSVRTLPPCRAACLQHIGPFESIGRSYEKIFHYLHHFGFTARLPSREVFLKGPGMIFRGNPQKYVTEIQIVFQEETESRSWPTRCLRT